MSKHVTLGEQFQKQTFEALALQVPGGHFLIFTSSSQNSKNVANLITVGDARRVLVTVVAATAADVAAPLRTATGLLVEPVRSSLAFLRNIHHFNVIAEEFSIKVND